MTLDTLKLLTEQLLAELPRLNTISTQDQHRGGPGVA